MLPGTSGTGRTSRSWSFKSKSSSRSDGESAALDKMEKKEEKRRKKEEARAHRERLAQEKMIAWKEDIPVYGSRAST